MIEDDIKNIVRNHAELSWVEMTATMTEKPLGNFSSNVQTMIKETYIAGYCAGLNDVEKIKNECILFELNEAFGR